MSINNVTLTGRLTRQPELKYIPAGDAVATFTLAVDRPYTKDQTDFINIVTWKKTAENCAQYLDKGSQAAVQGRIQVRNYEDKSGQKRYVTEVVADRVEFLSKPKEQYQGTEVDYSDSDVPF